MTLTNNNVLAEDCTKYPIGLFVRGIQGERKIISTTLLLESKVEKTGLARNESLLEEFAASLYMSFLNNFF